MLIRLGEQATRWARRALTFAGLVGGIIGAAEAQRGVQPKGAHYGFAGPAGYVFGMLAWAEGNCNGMINPAFMNEAQIYKIADEKGFNAASQAGLAEATMLSRTSGIEHTCGLIDTQYGRQGTVSRGQWIARR